MTIGFCDCRSDALSLHKEVMPFHFSFIVFPNRERVCVCLGLESLVYRLGFFINVACHHQGSTDVIMWLFSSVVSFG